MLFFIIIAAIVILVIVSKGMKSKQREQEYEELKERIHNSQMIKELDENYLRVFFWMTASEWAHKQIDYYDECDRRIIIFNKGIYLEMWNGDEWQTMYAIDFIEDLGYKPLLDNGLIDGKNCLKSEDVFCVFANEVSDIFEKELQNYEIKLEYPKYHSGFESQKQPDGTYKTVRVGDEQVTIRYKVPKSVSAKQI